MIDLSHPIFESSSDGIVIVDSSGTIVAANPAASDLFRRDRLVGLQIEDLVPPDARTDHESMRKTFTAHPHARRMGQGLGLRGLRGDGDVFPADIALTPLGDGTTAAVVRDTTELHRSWRRMEDQETALVMLEDRERIARDLHDTVIQEVFAVGLKLNALAGRLALKGTTEEETQARDLAMALDATIDRLRRTIFDIRKPPSGHVTEELLEIIYAMTHGAGIEIVEHQLDPAVEQLSPRLVEHLLATVREAVANVVRHAQARRLSVEISVELDWCALVVVDDGVGLSVADEPGFGLENMRRRSETLGGSFVAGSAEPNGTRLEWRVPVG